MLLLVQQLGEKERTTFRVSVPIDDHTGGSLRRWSNFLTVSEEKGFNAAVQLTERATPGTSRPLAPVDTLGQVPLQRILPA